VGHIAAIELDVVDLPRCKGIRILLEELPRSRKPRAGLYTGVFIDAKLQPQRMNLLPHPRHTVGKLLRIGSKRPISVTLLRHPAIINGDRVIPLLSESAFYQSLRLRKNQIFIDM